MMRKCITGTMLCLFLGLNAAAASGDLDALVEKVRQEALREASYDQERIERFLNENASGKQLLKDAKAQLRSENKRADRLRKEYEENENTLTEYEQSLVALAGDLNDLFAIVRQTALNADSVMNTSLVSAEHEERSTFLRDLGKGERPPSMDSIKKLWTTVLTEIAESGKVVKFNATVIKPQGDEARQKVTRAGVFTSVSNGNFLRYLPDSGKLVELSRQPAKRFQNMASALESSSSGVQPMALDPSKGAILSLMVQSPDLKERLQQGGVIGYIILVLGAIGVLLVIQRFLSLMITRHKLARHVTKGVAYKNNPLSRLQDIVSGMVNSDPETISLRLDEQLAEESSRLNRGLPTVAVLAAVSPLLGLLGTVTGMIETFQSITLFGTGDPKLMSGGISQALVTTQLGLAVAIPLVLFHSLLTGRANRMTEKLGKYSSDLIAQRELA